MAAPLILVLCTGNSCRSHFAEGILQKALGEGFAVASAGSKPAGYVHPMAIRAMAEIGMDISAHTSKHLDQFLVKGVETVITVCGNADQACPIFPGLINRHHFPFEDPAHAEGTDEEKMAVFRRVRDEIREVFEAYAAGRLDEARVRPKSNAAPGTPVPPGIKIEKTTPSIVSTRVVRIGIVGAGGIVKDRHLPALKKMPEVKIVAVCNSTLESSRRFCAEYLPDAEPMEHWPELVSRDDIDAVWIGTTPYLHAEISCYVLRAGKHVFCQARMAMNLAEAQRMWEVSMSNPELVATLCPPPHGMKGDRVVRSLLAEGVIGKPHQVVLQSKHAAWLDREAPAHWRQRFEISGLQVLTFGIYVEVLQRWLGDITAVMADGVVVFPERQGYTVEVPDMLHVLCRFRNGALGNLAFSGVASHPQPDQVAIHGSEGTLTYNFGTDEIQLGTRNGAMTPVEIPEDLAKEWTVERDFINAVLDPSAPRPRPDFNEGTKYMRVVQAAAESMDGGDLVRVA